eukprot:gene3434-6816_t
MNSSPVVRTQVLGPWWTNKRILNDGVQGIANSNINECELTASEIVSTMRRSMLALKGEFMDEDGLQVNYPSIKESPKFQEYCEIARTLKSTNILSLTLQERKAFFINVYNTLVIHALVEGMLESFPGGSLSRLKLYASASYNIGGYILSLNDIENGILRGNRPSAAPFSKVPFPPNDPNLPLVLDCDPRIHFALNCGAKSCPPIAVYSPDTLDKSLDRVTKSFLNDGVTFSDDKETEVTLSMIFKWYRVDFGNNDMDVLNWIQSRANEAVATRVNAVLQSTTSNPKIVYAKYNWDLNSSK